MTNCEIANTTGAGSAGVSVDDSSGNWVITNNAINNTSFFGVDVTTAGSSTLSARIEDNTMTNCTGAIGLLSEGTSDHSASVKDNIFTNSAGVGSAFELTCGDDSTLCLDLESNTNDDSYSIAETDDVLSVLSIEQLSVLTDPQPGGAGNTGTVNILTGALVDPPTEVADGFCGF